MKRILKITFIFVCSLTVTTENLFAQQDPMYSQYMFNMLSVNPAYAGAREMVSMTAMYRQQWVGIEGAPTTLTFGIDAPIKHQRMALGLNVVNDKIGITKDLMINAVYAYRIRFINNGALSFGLQAGVNQHSADLASVNTTTYYGGSSNDKAFSASMSNLFPNFGFGAYYYTDRFFASAGVPRMLKNNLRGENNPTMDFTSFPNRQNRHMFLSAGYIFDLNEDWTAKPSIMLKGVYGAPMAGDINANFWWKNTIGGGVSYRSEDAVVAMLEFRPRKEFQFGYAYDMTISGLAGTNSGSHELMLRYEPHASKVKANTSSKKHVALKNNLKKKQVKKRKNLNRGKVKLKSRR